MRYSVTFCFLIFFQIKSIDFQAKMHVDDIPCGIECIVGVDIGGTNSDFGFFQIKNRKPILLFSVHTQTGQIKNFTAAMVDVLHIAQEEYDISVKHACVGAPGFRSANKDYSAGGKAGFCIDGKDIKQKTGLTTVLVLNDFEIIGYGIKLLDDEGIVEINKGKFNYKAPQVIIGSGTGLGTSYMIWNEQLGHYISVWSELGCIPFCPYIQQELNFSEDYKAKRGKLLDWNHVLGGIYGIEGMRTFLLKKSDAHNIEAVKAGTIFDSYGYDPVCTDAVDMYMNLYARFAKIAALSLLPFGGLYIVGGVVSKNVDLFKRDSFLEAFFDDCACTHSREKFHGIPVYLITDYNVSLYGAAQYLLYELQDSGDPLAYA